ncbi:Outer membrane lipoprotein omp16 (Peptidoglycan-associated lipoprotein) [Candidatus Terasakiella magnetica]|nr:Outer membrane lipoprotein omp16 (Peptidoglycan-associated lipoprotein) [Candidatus Terasakiella magnetica]
MTDSRRDFLLRFAATALTAAGAGCEFPGEQKPIHNVVYGAPPPTPRPLESTSGSTRDFIEKAGDRVFFDFDKATLRADAKATLAKQAAWLKYYPNYSMTIEGHADERGTREYNLALGERRANSVKEFLSANGVASSRIKTVSYGKERPVALGSNEAAWVQNRRAVTVLSQ